MCMGDVVSSVGSLITSGLAAVGLGSLFGSDDSGGSGATTYLPPTVEAPAAAPVGAVATDLKEESDLATDDELKKRKKGRDNLRNDLTNTTGTAKDSASTTGINILG